MARQPVLKALQLGLTTRLYLNKSAVDSNTAGCIVVDMIREGGGTVGQTPNRSLGFATEPWLAML